MRNNAKNIGDLISTSFRLKDRFIIAVSNVWDEGGDFKHLNAAHYIDKERDRYERKIRQGVVFRAPSSYSEANCMPIDIGTPPPRLYVSHDDIQQKVNEGYKDLKYLRYHPGMLESFPYLSFADYGRRITAKDGDSIYFHPSVTEPENLLGTYQDKELYLAGVHELISVGTVPQGFYILVEPHAEERERSGLLLNVDEQDKLLEGTVKYSSSIAPGTIVNFQQDSNWEFIIEGQRLYAMLEENIIFVGQNETSKV